MHQTRLPSWLPIGCLTMLHRKYYICFLLCYAHIFAKFTIPFNKNTNQERITNSGVEIAINNFNFRKLTTVFAKDVEEKNVNEFLKSFKGTVTVDIKRDEPSQVVVIAENFTSFMKVLDKLKPDLKGKTLLNSGTNILIIIFSNSKKIARITEILWSYHAVNAVIITIHEKKIGVFTYFPYKNHLNCQNTEPHLIGYWNESLPMNLYPDKMTNMKECPLYISTNKLYHPATEQMIPLQTVKKAMIRLLRDVMNFTPIISTRDYVSIDSDRAKNWSDSLNDVITGEANISTCSIPLSIDGSGLLGFSAPYFRVRLAWLAPPLSPAPVYWRLFSPLNGYLWLVLLILLLCVTSLPFALKVKAVKRFCYRHFRKIDKLRSVAIRTWGVMLGQPIRLAPRRFRDFYIISLWMWFTFVVRSAYQSVLIVSLKTDTLIGAYVDLKEAVDDGFTFGGRGGILAHFVHDAFIKDSFEVISEQHFETVFHDVIDGRRKFVLATSLEYAWAYCFAQGKKEDECGQVLSDSIMTVPLAIWTRLHSPFKRPLATWLPRLIESGLLERDSIRQPSLCCSKTSDPTPITRHQILSCMLCLLFGYTIAFIVFLLEIVNFKFGIVRQSFRDKCLLPFSE